ncbi:Diatom spindle kinesin-1 [Phytophthora citrophthora]|uniref:Diatom spindle kinesin-1 n=1 Tax=Phytophthora citrophthora TaxID=4793 RepID=A0AAD9LSG5_9STRA|nr:Diatom spindle kinesin-1 [Phytophthora citrophthora]
MWNFQPTSDMAWRANNARPANAGRGAPSSLPRAKPTMQAIAEIEKNREDRRRAMAAAKRERERESQMNEKLGHPGDVDFQRMIKAFREQNKDKSRPHAEAADTKITICVRKRPVNAKEVKKHDYDAITCLNPMAIVHDCKLKVDGITKYLDSNAFNFDHTFDENATNQSVYMYTAQPLVKFVFHDGGHATVFAYGQTGSGKTHTMQGIQSQIAADVFAQADEFDRRGYPLDICVSFFEIYGGRCQDLLHRQVLTIREDGAGEVQIVDLEEVQPQDTEELLQVINKGNSLRTTHATEVNDVSSRSHCICQINLREKESGRLHGKLSLIDLAGSERGEDTKNHNRQRRMESAEINRSLLALKECFRALDSGGRGAHIPFRASKLTQVLKDSFVNAKARTVMIAAVSPCASSSDHTLNTLRYADRVKEKRVSADAFDEGNVDSDPVDVEDVQFEDLDGDDAYADQNEGGDVDGDFDDEEDYPLEDEDEVVHEDKGNKYRSDVGDGSNDGVTTSSHHARGGQDLRDDLSILRIGRRRNSNKSGGDPVQENEYPEGAWQGVVQTLYEEQESLLNTHMSAIQENAELLTEEGAMLAAIQNDDSASIEQYVSRLEEILAQKAQTISTLRRQLAAYRQHCEGEEEEKGGDSPPKKVFLRPATKLLSRAVTATKGQASRLPVAVETSLYHSATQTQSCQAARSLRAVADSRDSSFNALVALAGLATLVGATGLVVDATQLETPPDKKHEKHFEYAEAVDIIRQQVSEFRTTLKSSETRIPKAFPIKKIGISRIHAPNGVSTIRIEFACPSFVDQEAILGRFLLKLQKSSTPGSRQAVEVMPAPLDSSTKKSVVESYEQPAVTYLYTNGSGSFQFLRDTTSLQATPKFVFYKDEYLTQGEIDAVVGAYKEIYSYANVNAFFRHDLEQRRKNALVGRGRNLTTATSAPPDSKEEAIQQLQGLGIDVFEPTQNENSLTWDSLAGYEKVKLEIEDTVVLALQNPELYERIAQKTRCRYESNRPRAVLFEGPPGTGKTLSARIIAQQAGIPMIHIPIESVVSKWYGDSEKKMSAIFDACEKLDGAIIFIDEIDALAGDRSGGTMHEASRRILSVLLQKVEGFASAKKTTVVCATNRKQDLDPALISRFDLSIRYNLPDEKTRRAVFARYAKQLSEEELSQLAVVSPQLSCRDIKEICEYAERKWASKVLKKEETTELPTLQTYMEAVKTHMVGLSSHDSHPDVYEA